MNAFLHAAWDLLSKPLLSANGTLVLASAGVFQWVLPRLPERITLQVDLYGHRNRLGSPQELWAMGLVMAISVWLPALAALTASTGALDPIRHPKHQTLLVAHRRHTVRIVECLVLGLNLTIASTWLGLAVGQLPNHALPSASLLPVAPGIMALTLLVTLLLPLLVLLPKHVRLNRTLQHVVRELQSARFSGLPDMAPWHKMDHSRTAGGNTRYRGATSVQRRPPLWVVLVLVPSIMLLLSVWLSP